MTQQEMLIDDARTIERVALRHTIRLPEAAAYIARMRRQARSLRERAAELADAAEISLHCSRRV